MNEFWTQYLSGFKTSEQQVLKLSDYFNKRLGATPWKQSGMPEAYMAYFFPLNYLRLQYVLGEAGRLQFPMRSILDIGSGPGVAHAALLDLGYQGEYQASEPAEAARSLHSDWCKAQGEQRNIFVETGKLSAEMVRGKTLLLSYVVNELDAFPEAWFEAESLIILEPSTRDQGRKLMELRSQLIEQGFSIWAPCTHQHLCPLLTESKNDWCHQRIHTERPEYLQKLEAKMQIRNDTLTFSYLLASRRLAPAYSERTGRIIGDTLYENGKTRQAFCRGPKREFLTWMGKPAKKMDPWPRGLIFELPEDVVEKSNELRLSDTHHPSHDG